ncbi:hypothetical protein IEO21_07467 [Rhodonia placenta]|uniref:Endonuclease III homolog n=1 Tax=Rhodonia placenta TaxID=104341 RepID=A0A8H7NY05_9APHY|nr:hypothetical protein IEO21_07467 [Postia placenta]
MSAHRKRSRPPTLVGRPSACNSGVTLFTLGDLPEGESLDAEPLSVTPRRSKRAKHSASVKSESVAEVAEHVNCSPSRRTASVVKESGAASRCAGSSVASPSKQSVSKKKQVLADLEMPHPAPPRWREVYDTIKDMRSRVVAPVDTMGAGAAQLGETDPKCQRFSTLVSLMLSSQTKDEVTSAAVKRLRQAMGGSLSVDAIRQADAKTISDAICKVGFWRRKTDYIKRTAQRLYDGFDSDVPRTEAELCSLPGVGPKMAILTLHVAWKVNAGVGVDVHVHRITNRLGWHNPSTKTPEETRSSLEAWLPDELRPTFTGLLVGFGQTICLPIGPRCESCQLSDGLCPSAQKSSAIKMRKGGSTIAEDTGPSLEIKFEEQDFKANITLEP